MSIDNKKTFLLSLGLLLTIALLFWTQSRFPALDQKAQMGQRTHFSALAFDVLYPLSPEQNTVQRIFYSSINWGYTNWKGMTFGLAFAAAFLSLLACLKLNQPRRSNHWLNVFKGSVMGAPLGVCANCSTPIAVGMYQGGIPVASALSALSSSPTLNFVVVTMSLSLLPLELVLSKYAMVLVYLWIVLPLLLNYLQPSRANAKLARSLEQQSTTKSVFQIGKPQLAYASCPVDMPGSWFQALQCTVVLFVKKLGFITKATLPFMILAGFLGALLAEFAPLDTLSVLPLTLGALLLVSLMAALFPVPIAFDVIVSVALLSMGVSTAYVGAVFFALGIFSLYPAMVIARDLSAKLSLAMMLSVIMLGVASGLLAESLDTTARANQAIEIQGSLKAERASQLLRRAARLCHRLGEPEQYQCFEQFVIRQLASQFNAEACVYLEDAREYRQRCESTFHYLTISERAVASQNPETCAVLPEEQRLQCQYDLAFQMAVDQQDLKPCDVLTSQDARQHCQNEVLILNLELYDSEQSCQSLGRSASVASCLSEMNVLREQQTLISQNDLEACQSLATTQERQYCQGVIMVNLLEQGASVELCRNVSGVFLQQRCVAFYDYFEALLQGSIDDCEDIADKPLRARCEMEATQSALAREMQQLRFDLIHSSLDISQPEAWQTSLQEPLTPDRRALNGKRIVNTSEPEHVVTQGAVTITATPFNSKSHHGDDKFQPLPAQSIGLHASPPSRVSELIEPFAYGRGISSGDFNLDAWPDLALAMRDRIRIYQNIGGRFELAVELKTEQGLNPFLVAFADINGDLWPDLLVSYYGGANHIYMNRNGVYAVDDFVSLMPEQSNLTMAAGFADPDQDGDLDIIIGSWSFGDLRNFRPVFAENYYAENSSGKNARIPEFTLKALSGPRGETLSVLLSDLNDNGKAELVIGNDRESPDLFYHWQQSAYQLTAKDTTLPDLSAFNTMSLDSADINNDLRLDYFAADMSFAEGEGVEYCLLPGITDVDECERMVEAEQALSKGKLTWCQRFQGSEFARDCLVSHLIKLANESENSAFCENIDQYDLTKKMLCQNAATKLPPKAAIPLNRYVRSEQKNVLMQFDENTGRFESVADKMGVTKSYWSWNAKFADLDNDGWQDLYIGNGYLFGSHGRHLHSNVFFHNQGGVRFEQAEVEFGLVDYLNTPSFTYLDFDLDGDLDIVSNRFGASPGVYVNQSQNNAIQFALEDQRAHSSAIGAKVVIRYGADKKYAQLREIKLSGGFLSFDMPLAHFGMGPVSQIEQLNIQWNDGTNTQIQHRFATGKLYRAVRRAGSAEHLSITNNIKHD